MLPIALVGPSAGVIVDRFDRRRIMIAADVIRGVAGPRAAPRPHAVDGLARVRRHRRHGRRVGILRAGAIGDRAGDRARARIWCRPTPSPRGRGRRCWRLAHRSAGVVAAVLGRDAAFLINSAVVLSLGGLSLAAARAGATAGGRAPRPAGTAWSKASHTCARTGRWRASRSSRAAGRSSAARCCCSRCSATASFDSAAAATPASACSTRRVASAPPSVPSR